MHYTSERLTIEQLIAKALFYSDALRMFTGRSLDELRGLPVTRALLLPMCRWAMLREWAGDSYFDLCGAPATHGCAALPLCELHALEAAKVAETL